MKNIRRKKFLQRKKRVRAKIFGTSKRPRLSVFRSHRFIYAQIIDDDKGETLVAANEKEEMKDGKRKETVVPEKGEGKKERAYLLGKALAKKALARKIKKIIFDRSGYRYHGRVKSLADGAREGGLEF